MSSILIVDDEYYLVQGVKSSLDWEALGITQIYEAYSAEQARKIYEQYSVDILLADVEMPKESGLALIKWIKENGYHSINLLLTGHADFNYAQSAIGLQVYRYILKPADINELTAALEEVQQKLAKEKKSKKGSLQIKQLAFWRDLYRGIINPNPDAITQYMEKYEIPETFLSANYYFSYLKISAPDLSTMPDPREKIAFETLVLMLQNSFPMPSFCTDMGDQGYMISTQLDTLHNENELKKAFHELIQTLAASYADLRFALYMFAEAPLYSASYAYELLHRYASQLLTRNSQVVFIMDTAVPAGGGRSALSDNTAFSDETLSKWSGWLIKGRPEDVLLELKYQFYGQKSVFSVKDINNAYYGLLHMIFNLFSEQKIPTTEAVILTEQSGDLSQVLSTPETFLHWAEQLFTAISELIQTKKVPDSMMGSIFQYIRTHLSECDLDRTNIADAVHVSPDYLSYLFHKESGKVLSSYINEERIALARKLLSATDKSLSEISEACGFANDTYFHKQFKKITGQTPSSYRSGFRNSGKK